MLQVAISMVWEARVIQIRPHIASKKKMKLGYEVESSEIYLRRDPLDHETFFGHYKITRAPQPRAGNHRPAPDLEVDNNQLKAPFIRSSVLPDDVRKRDPAAVGKVIFEAVGVSGVADITGILVGGALGLEGQDPDKCAFCSCGSKTKT